MVENAAKSTDFEKEKIVKNAAKSNDLEKEKMVKSAAKSTNFEEEKWSKMQGNRSISGGNDQKYREIDRF